MDINKDNYEEYFLLFADNELSEQEKNIVEVFVKEHPDLEEEFLIIKQSVLKPENDLVLRDKNPLFRHTKKFINHANYQEVFVLYNDNELKGFERNETEAFLTENPSLKNEFESLQKTKLQPDKSIIFPDKDLLFKREGSGKVIPFKWWRAVAAAVLLGTGIWIGINFQKKNNTELPTVKNNISEKPGKILALPKDTTSIQQVTIVGDKKAGKLSLKQKPLLKNHIGKLPPKATEVNDYQVLRNQKKTNQKQTDNLPVVNSMDNKIEKEESNIIAIEEDKNGNDHRLGEMDMKDNKEIKLDETVNTGKNVTPDVLAASYTSDENANNNNYAFYNITEEKFSKSKVGSFLHKVKRIIERKISPLNNSKNQREVAVN